jgi:hypothetical protein
VGRLLFNVLAMVAEFESDLIRMRTREGMKIAKANGRLRGKQPKLKPNQAKHLLELHNLATYTQAELAELFGVGQSTIYRTLERMRPRPPEPERPFAPCESADDGAAPDIIPIKQSKGLARGVRGRLAPPCASVDDRFTERRHVTGSLCSRRVRLPRSALQTMTFSCLSSTSAQSGIDRSAQS